MAEPTEYGRPRFWPFRTSWRDVPFVPCVDCGAGVNRMLTQGREPRCFECGGRWDHDQARRDEAARVRNNPEPQRRRRRR